MTGGVYVGGGRWGSQYCSLYEINSIFDIIKELGLIDSEIVENLRKDLDEISAMVSGLIKSLNK